MVKSPQCVQHRLCSGELIHDGLHIGLVIDDGQDGMGTCLGVDGNFAHEKSVVPVGAGPVVGRNSGSQDAVCLGGRKEVLKMAAFSGRRRLRQLKELSCRLVCIGDHAIRIGRDQTFFQCIQNDILAEIEIKKLGRMMAHQGIAQERYESMRQKDTDHQHDHCGQ